MLTPTSFNEKRVQLPPASLVRVRCRGLDLVVRADPVEAGPFLRVFSMCYLDDSREWPLCWLTTDNIEHVYGRPAECWEENPDTLYAIAQILKKDSPILVLNVAWELKGAEPTRETVRKAWGVVKAKLYLAHFTSFL